MRTLLFSLVLAATACASNSAGPGGKVNVYYVRQDIKSAIEASPGEAGPRSIVSMGAVTNDRAVVYTDAKDGRREETWVRGANGWTMTEGKVVSTAR